MSGNKAGFSVKLAIMMSFLLLSVNFIFGYILVNYSKYAMKTLINHRMLDISKTAADMLDGDILEKLKKEDKGTKEYQQINDILAVFQKNIELKYIYCIRDLGNKNFVFSVDPTVLDPGEFGEPVVYTDALYQASLGVSAVDTEPYSDSWGRFYSSYSPVFNSSGKVSGIVAVDFSADWYEQQITKLTLVILVCCLIVVISAIILIFVATGNFKKQLTIINSDINEVMKDVKDLTQQINPNSITEISDTNTYDGVQRLGQHISIIKDELRKYIENLHTQANSMINALSSEYRSVYYVNLDKDEGICYQSDSEVDYVFKQGEHFAYKETFVSYAKKYVTEKYLDSFLHFIDINEIRKGLENERIITFRYLVRRNNIETYEMLCIAGVRHPEDRDDHIVHAVGIGFTDVDAETRRTMAQSQALSDALSVAEGANKAKTAFLSNMSHEIRTPMNAIIGLDKIALNDKSISKTTRDYLEKIGTSAEHLLGIINDILDMSRIEAGRMVLRKEVFSLPALLKQIDVIIGGQCLSKKLKWKMEYIDEDSKYYIGDDLKLKQVLINLLGNSVKFTPEGGSIYFSAERIAHFDNKSVLCFIVKDTGIGMSKDFLPKLFEPFSQEDLSLKTKYGSTGLGMSITKSIVEMMNGEIKVDSEKNIGTTFRVTVTLVDSKQKIDETGEITLDDMNVLIIDDDPVACEYAKMELEKAGVSSDISLSGAEAIEKVKLKHTRRESYNLILVDWKMPEMDGLETTKQIRSIIGDDSAIVILTSFHWDDILEEATNIGVDSFIAKPLKADSILQQFKQAFALKAKKAVNKIDLKGRRVLLAEDMLVNAEIIKMILDMREMKTEHAVNGKIAVEMFSSHPEGYYDAILMDMRMPEMDGLEATELIRAMNRVDAKEIPIIALTANAFDEDVQRSLQSGLNAHLSKPVEPENLFETLESFIRP